MTTSGCPITDNLVRNIPSVSSRFQLHVEKAILKYCSIALSVWAQFVLELTKTCNRRRKEVQKIELPLENMTIFAIPIPFLKCKLYSQYKPLLGGAGQCLREVMLHEASTQERNVLYSRSKSVSHLEEFSQDNSILN